MDVQKTIESARELLQQGDTGTALSTLTTFLQGQSAQSGNLRALQVLQSQYSNVRERAIKGLVSAEETQRAINNINDSLYAVMEAIGQGKTVAGVVPNQSKTLIWAGIALVAALIGGGLWFLLKQDPPKSDSKPCPVFSEVRPRILILPFTNFGSPQEEANVASSIKYRIETIADKNKFPLAVRVHEAYPNSSNLDRNTAQEIQEQCKCNMVVWGVYQKKGTGLELDARFITRQESGRTDIVRVNDLFDVANEQKFRSLDDAVFSLCGQLAYAMGNDTLATKWMNKIQKKAPHDEKIWEKMQ
jgi:hypothetical protein